MKAFRFWVLFLLIGMSVFTYHGCASNERIASNPEMIVVDSRKSRGLILKTRKLKEYINREDDADYPAGIVHLADYRPINPAPSSKASRHGPTYHRGPLQPFIPKPPPPPPSQPEHGGFH